MPPPPASRRSLFRSPPGCLVAALLGVAGLTAVVHLALAELSDRANAAREAFEEKLVNGPVAEPK